MAPELPDVREHPDPLNLLAGEAHGRIFTGQFATKYLPENPVPEPTSLKAALTDARGTFPVVAEVKPASPTAGTLRENADPAALAKAFAEAGARGVSVLAEERRFGGSPLRVREAAAAVPDVPILWKDFVVSTDQVNCARACGASAILLIRDLFTRNLAEGSLEAMIAAAHKQRLEVVLEVYDEVGLTEALATDADVVGVNARDLRAPGLPVDLTRAARVLGSVTEPDRPVLALSGVRSREDLERVVTAGATGALVGGYLMESTDPGATLEELIS